MSLPPLRVTLSVKDRARAKRLVTTLEALGYVVPEDPDQRTDIVLTDHIQADAAHAAPVLMLSDARIADPVPAGVVRPDAPPAVLDAALRAVAAGLQVREPMPASGVGFAAAEEALPHALLTPREMDILSAIGDGLSNKAVARRLGISAHTVKFHLEAIFAKLDASSRAEAVAKGLRRGLIEL
ncbi:MAG: response regulator transcription factor [Acetobacteraceae bacterium]|nr:response regulator transcription factor [Acetobacteraceae bacterium]